MESNTNYKLYWVIALLLFVIFLLVDCDRTIIPTTDCGQIRGIVYDTARTRHIDTIPFVDTIKYYVKVEVPVPVYDTVDSTNTYTSDFEDSLIKGSIISKVDGVLVAQNFSYTPKFPKYINTTDSIFITKTVTVEQPKKLKMFVGVVAGSNGRQFNLGPQLLVEDKGERIYLYNYNILDQSHNVGLAIKLKVK